MHMPSALSSLIHVSVPMTVGVDAFTDAIHVPVRKTA